MTGNTCETNSIPPNAAEWGLNLSETVTSSPQQPSIYLSPNVLYLSIFRHLPCSSCVSISPASSSSVHLSSHAFPYHISIPSLTAAVQSLIRPTRSSGSSVSWQGG